MNVDLSHGAKTAGSRSDCVGQSRSLQLGGLLARQVGVDRERNSVVVWVTFAAKSDLYEWLATEEGQADHAEGADLDSIIATFEMYDLEPVSGRL